MYPFERFSRRYLEFLEKYIFGELKWSLHSSILPSAEYMGIEKKKKKMKRRLYKFSWKT